MDTEKLNKWLSLSANIAVLIGIIALVYELQQNNIIAKAQMRSEIAQSAINNMGLNQTPEGMAIAIKRQADEELNRGEILWIRTFYRREFRAWENVYYQYRVGLYDENELESYKVFWKARANACEEMYTDFYFDNREQFEPFFREEMDSIFEGATC